MALCLCLCTQTKAETAIDISIPEATIVSPTENVPDVKLEVYSMTQPDGTIIIMTRTIVVVNGELVKVEISLDVVS